MRTFVTCTIMTLRPILGIAFIMLVCTTVLNLSLTTKDVVRSLAVGVAVFVVIELLGFLMTCWYSLRHGFVPEGATKEPIDEFDVFR